MQQKIVLIGGPGTGKSSILNELISRGFHCKPEISREVTLEAQKKGIDQLFLTDPLLFSNLLLEGREKQYLDAKESTEKFVFFDRGIPDVHAYYIQKYLCFRLGKKYTPLIMSDTRVLKKLLKFIII